MEFSRRAFLHRLGGAATLAAVAPWLRPDRINSVGIQLYTVRTRMTHEPERTLAALAEIGYREVELAGLYGVSAGQMRAMLDRCGLAAPSSHVPLEDLRDRGAETFAVAHALGQRYIVCPWINESDRTLDGYKRVAAAFNTIGDAAHRSGLQFAFHNSNFGYAPIAHGVVPYDLLLAECDASLVQMEMDIYWLVEGGGDPLAYFARWPGRFPMLHMKDRTAGGAMVDVGQGAIDFASIVARAKAAGVKHYFVENDEAPQPLASARTSYTYLSRLEF